MNLGGLDGSVTTLGGRVKLTGKAAGLARRAVYAVSFCFFFFSFLLMTLKRPALEGHLARALIHPWSQKGSSPEAHPPFCGACP